MAGTIKVFCIRMNIFFPREKDSIGGISQVFDSFDKDIALLKHYTHFNVIFGTLGLLP